MSVRAETTTSGRSKLKLESFLPYVLTRLSNSISVGLSGIYVDEYSLSVPEWRIISNLAEHGTLNARQIVDFANMEKSTVSRAVKGLSARSLVSQKLASVDNRAKDLALTRSGEALYRRIAPRVLDWEKELLEGLDVSEYRDLLYLLDKLTKRIQTLN